MITPRHDYYPLTPEAQKQIPWFLRMWVTPRQPPDRRVVWSSLIDLGIASPLFEEFVSITIFEFE